MQRMVKDERSIPRWNANDESIILLFKCVEYGRQAEEE
jgi:hypothetical protein